MSNYGGVRRPNLGNTTTLENFKDAVSLENELMAIGSLARIQEQKYMTRLLMETMEQ